MIRTRIALALVPLLAAFAACDKDKDKDGGPRDDTPPWSFPNTVDRAGFDAKLADLAQMSDRAHRIGLPRGQTRLPDAGALAFAERFAGMSAPSDASGADCADARELFSLSDPAPAPRPSGFSLDAGQSCGDAIRQIRSYYAQALDTLQVDVARLRSLKPGGTLCGFRVDDHPVDPKLAAVGYRLTPLEAPIGLTHEEVLVGGGGDGRVAFHTKVHTACDRAVGDCGGGVPASFSLTGTTQAIGNTAEHTLDLANEYTLQSQIPDPQSGATRDAVTQLKSTLNVSGLTDGGTLKVQETATYTLSGADPTPGADAYRLGLSLTVEELAGNKLRLSGNVSSNDATGQSFTLELVRNGESCQVGKSDGGAPQPGGTPAPTPKLEAKDLEGTWKTECASDSLGRLGYPRYVEAVNFTGGKLTHELTSFSDNECFTGKETARVTLTGSFQLGGSRSDGTSTTDVPQYDLDYAYDAVQVTLLSPSLVTSFNADKLCNKTDWEAGKTVSFAAGSCWFDLGTSSLLNLNSLKRTREYTTVKPAGTRLLELARTSGFAGDSADLRATVASGSKRKLKKEP